MFYTCNNRRGMAIPLVMILIVIIGLIVFSLSRTGSQYYRLVTSEIKALQIEKFMNAFVAETTSNLDKFLNLDKTDKALQYKDNFLKALKKSENEDIKNDVFSKEFRSLFSKSIREEAKNLGINFDDFMNTRVILGLTSTKGLPCPGWMKKDNHERRISLKISADLSFMGITRNKGMVIQVKVVRVNIPILSKFTLFIRNAYEDQLMEGSTGYNITSSENGLLTLNDKKVSGVLLDNCEKLALNKRGKIFFGGTHLPPERITIRLSEEKSVRDSRDGKCPFSNILECGVKDSIAYGRRGDNKTVPNGFISTFHCGFGKYLKSKYILSQFTLDHILFKSKFPQLKKECGMPALSIEPSNFDLCCPLLLFGNNSNLVPTIVYGDVYRAYVKLCEYHIHGTSGVLYYLAKGDHPEPPHVGNSSIKPRDCYIDINELMNEKADSYFNSLTRLKYSDYMSTVSVTPYSADGNLNKSNQYKDSDVGASTEKPFDLNNYNFVDFDGRLNSKATPENDWKNGLGLRICGFYDSEEEFKKDTLNGGTLTVKSGVVLVNGDLDLTKNQDGKVISKIENQSKCIIVVKGDLKLPNMIKKEETSIISFICVPVYKDKVYKGGGRIKLYGNRIEATLVTWLEHAGAIEFNALPCTIKGTLALWKLGLKRNFIKTKSIKVLYDRNTLENSYYFSFLPSRGSVW